MYCNRCGTKIEEGARFCRSCGSAVSPVYNANVLPERPLNTIAEEPGKLLYESRGAGQGRGLAVILLSLLIGIGGILFVLVATSTDMQYKLLGGRFENPSAVLIMGIVFFLIGCIIIDMGVGLLQSWIQIYSDCVKGQALSLVGAKRVIQLYYKQISSVCVEGYTIRVISGGRAIKFVCSDKERAFELINQRIPH